MAREYSVQKVLATTQGKTYAILLVTVFMIVLMFFLAIRPAFLSITDQNEQNDEKRDYLEDLTNKENNLKLLAEQESEFSDQLVLLYEYLPEKRDDEFFVANISRIADNNNVRLRNITFQQSQIPEKIELQAFGNLLEVAFTISLQGNLSDLSGVISHLEQFPAVIDIHGITYGLDDADQDEILPGEAGVYNLDIEASYYFYNSANII